MFPLGKVLFPGGLLQLHVFEDRYKTMMSDVMTSDRHFGVVLIERGSEVGGGDTRVSIGTIARVLEVRRMEDGRWLVLALGTNRLRVDRWLFDGPYPMAEAETFPDVGRTVLEEGEWAALSARMRRVLSDLVEFGDVVTPTTFGIFDNPTNWSFRLADLGPFAELDRQRLLEALSTPERNALLAEFIEEVDRFNKLRLKIGEEAGEGGG